MANLFGLSGHSYPDSSGNPYLSAKLYVYLTGTTTAQDSFTTAALSVANANPVVADSVTGIFPDIYLAAKRYKFVLKTSADVTVRTWDPIDATSQMLTAASDPSPTYPFLRYYNSGDSHVYRRNAADNAWIDEGLVDSLLNAASVAEILAATSTAKSATPDSVAAIWQRGSDITPSAGAISLPSAGGKHFNLVAGNFSSCSSAVGGREVWLHCAGVNVVTNNATSMECDGAANITTAAGDILVLVNKAATDATGANYRVHCIRKSGSPINLTDHITSQTLMEAMANNATAVTPLAMKWHPGVAKAWADIDGTGTIALDASLNCSGVADNGTGDYTPSFTTSFSSASYAVVCSCAVGSDQAFADIGTRAAGSVQLLAFADTGTPTDTDPMCFMAFGDQ